MATIIRTPHAAIKVWNYGDRITDRGAVEQADTGTVSEEIISTVSCLAITTAKSKSDPVGTFNFVLAPTRNWVSVLTPGSWCAIMMSNNPITKESWQTADPTLIKMFGRIDTCRVDVTTGSDGARQTRYLVAGRDWGSFFTNSLYVDGLIADPGGQADQGNSIHILLRNNVISGTNRPEGVSILENMQTLVSVLGKPLPIEGETSRLASSHYTVVLPTELTNFFKFVDADNASTTETDFSKLITIKHGSLITTEDDYTSDVQDGQGYIDTYGLQGTHPIWSILMDNCNHALNELYTELRWEEGGEDGKRHPQIALYCRVKPFSFQAEPADGITDMDLRSKFQNVATHVIQKETVISVNAGTNWEDKFNFIEIKIDSSDLAILGALTKYKNQAYQRDNSLVFDREGFRPLVYAIKQIPLFLRTDADSKPFEERLSSWANLLTEWYFDTHRLLNGKLVMTGSTDYIPVGDNIMFDAELVGVKHNYNLVSAGKKDGTIYVLAHVEQVQHSFSVSDDGAREYQTTISFVRGILVDATKQLIGEGALDRRAESLPQSATLNNETTFATAVSDDPELDS